MLVYAILFKSWKIASSETKASGTIQEQYSITDAIYSSSSAAAAAAAALHVFFHYFLASRLQSDILS